MAITSARGRRARSAQAALSSSAAICRKRTSKQDSRAAWREPPVSDTRVSIPSVVERTRSLAAGAPVVAAHFLGNVPVLVLGEEAVLLVARDEPPRRIVVHAGAILCSCTDGDRLITGGDDGKVAATGADGNSIIIAEDAKHRWIDHVACGPHDALAWSAGRQAFVRADKGQERM